MYYKSRNPSFQTSYLTIAIFPLTSQRLVLPYALLGWWSLSEGHLEET